MGRYLLLVTGCASTATPPAATIVRTPSTGDGAVSYTHLDVYKRQPLSVRAYITVTFADLGIEQDMVDALATKGIIEPFPIQEQTIPMGLSGQDIIGQAKTCLLYTSRCV